MTVKQRNKLLAEMTDEVGHAGPAQQLRAEHRPRQRRRPVALAAPRPAALHAPPGPGRAPGPGAGVPADRPADPRAAQRRQGPEPARAGRAARLHQDHGGRRADRAPRCRTTRICAGCCTRTSRSRCASSSPSAIDGHALRREIITTVLVNDTVNTGGSTFLHRLREETGRLARGDRAGADRGPRDLRARRGVGRRRGARQQGRRPTSRPGSGCTRAASSSAVRAGCSATGRSRWSSPRPSSSSPSGVEQVWAELPKLLRGADLEWYQTILRRADRARASRRSWRCGSPGFSSAFPTLDIVAIADRTGKDADGGRRGVLRPRRPAAASPS